MLSADKSSAGDRSPKEWQVGAASGSSRDESLPRSEMGPWVLGTADPDGAFGWSDSYSSCRVPAETQIKLCGLGDGPQQGIRGTSKTYLLRCATLPLISLSECLQGTRQDKILWSSCQRAPLVTLTHSMSLFCPSLFNSHFQLTHVSPRDLLVSSYPSLWTVSSADHSLTKSQSCD